MPPTEICRYLRNRFLNMRCARRGMKLGQNIDWGRSVRLNQGIRNGVAGKIEIGANSMLGDGAILDAWGGMIVLGEQTYVGPYAVLYGQGGLTIGSHSLLSMHCSILSSNHAIPSLKIKIMSQPDELLPTQIGNDVWIGAGAVVLGGVTIGDGCVVGAGAVVTKDLPPGMIAVGNPATILRHR